MAESVRKTLERAQRRAADAIRDGATYNVGHSADILNTAITEALAALTETERRVIDVLEDEMYAHVNPESPFYNDCNGDDLCAWCDEAKAIVAILGKKDEEN